jgi:hypothetical protein
MVFLGCAVVVAGSGAFLPLVTGYGTVLFQLLVLNSWYCIALMTSGMSADNHSAVVFLTAAVANALLFLILAVPIHVVSRDRCPIIGAVTLIGLALFHVSSLFVLFPATDGP